MKTILGLILCTGLAAGCETTTTHTSTIYGGRQGDVVTYENGEVIHSHPVTAGIGQTWETK